MASEDARELIHRAVAALQRNAWEEAARLAHAVLQRFGPEANSLMVLAGVRVHAGDVPGAIELYERARALMPRHIHILVNLASLYRAAGDLGQARSALEAALQVDPCFAVAHNNLGNIFLDLGQHAEAARCYERASALDPNYPDPKAGLGRIAADEHRLDEARALAERALQLAPQHPIGALTLARVKLRQDDAAGAAGLLEALLRDASLSVTNRAVAQGYLGETYQALGRYRPAFAAFTEANALRRGQFAAMPELERGPLAPASIARLTAFIEGADIGAWRPAPPAATTPVFMIGFPRSGTTLLEQILASHPDVTTLEERDTLLDAASELLSGEAAFARWADLPDREIERLRERYWQRVRTALPGPPGTPVFVDKQPLNAVLLPLIHRLFPAAKIILVLRDPRDVVLSCYQQRFSMNVAMYQLLRLDSACAYYDRVMHLVEVSRGKLPLRLHTLKYEDLIATFDQTVRGLLGFLELAWSEQVAGFAETARKRTIATPSDVQVVRPLYASARGKWQHYREFLEPCLPALAPWVRSFGYEDSAGTSR